MFLVFLMKQYLEFSLSASLAKFCWQISATPELDWMLVETKCLHFGPAVQLGLPVNNSIIVHIYRSFIIDNTNLIKTAIR